MRGLRALVGGWIILLSGAIGHQGVSAEMAAARQTAPAASQSAAPADQPVRATLNRYCVTCHNQKLKTANLELDAIPTDEALIGTHAEVWEKVRTRLRARSMPPAGMPRPDTATYDAAASWLETALDRAASERPSPGWKPMHRLNRVEYANAVRDLLGVQIDVTTLLAVDDTAKGFDNMADVLSLSPLRLEQYTATARRVSRLAVGDPTIGPAFESKTYEVPLQAYQDDRMSDDLPFGSRGGLAIRHNFPLDGEYLFRIRLRRTVYQYIRALAEPHELEVRIDGERVKVFTIGGASAKGRPAPTGFTGTIFGDPEWEQYLLSADEGLQVRVPVKAGTRRVTASFVKKVATQPEGVLQPPTVAFGYQVNESRTSPWEPVGRWGPAVHAVFIGGPYDSTGSGRTASRTKIFVCRPNSRAEEQSCAKRILMPLARLAYRRPATEDDVQTLLAFFKTGRAEGSFDDGIAAGLQRILVEPEFLFRIERDPATSKGNHQISDLELASRLSFFLWSSIPDDELLTLASQGRLRNPVVLTRQVRRMLADWRAKALVENFAGQWLSLQELPGKMPNAELFSEFDDNLREAFHRETELFFEHQLREDKPVHELLSANYSFVNERLARFYGIPKVYGSHFRLVTMADDRRGGLLGQASMLLATSYSTRTSPVLRGKWVLTNILGTPPPDPPPNVPSLPESGEGGGKPPSVRARLEKHRRNAVCATCHSRIDPLGFALEHYDAIGRWRDIDDSGTPVDSSSVLADGTPIKGLPGLRKVVLAQGDLFVEAVAERLLTYALGRGVEYYDRPALRRIVRGSATGGHRWSSIILGIVNSTPFQMRRAES